MKSKKETTQPANGWRFAGVCVLVGLSVFSLLSYVGIRWTHDYLLNTTNFTAMVGSLPQKPEVAAALSKFTTQKLFESVDVEARIKEALPEKAQFLAAPLAAQLQEATTDAASSFIQGPQFAAMWQFIVQTGHEGLMKVLEAPPIPIDSQKAAALKLQLGDLVTRVSEQVGQQQYGTVVNKSIDSSSHLIIDLRSGVQGARTITDAINVLYGILPLIALVGLLGALILSRHRSKTLLTTSLLVVLGTGLFIAGLKAVRPELVAQFEDPTYQAAVGVTWDTLTAGLMHILNTMLWVGIVIAILALLAGPYAWAVHVRHWLKIDEIKKSVVGAQVRLARDVVANYKWYFVGGFTLLVFVWWLIAQNVTWTSFVQSLLGILGFYLLIVLFAKKR